jgi:hypothetical protein
MERACITNWLVRVGHVSMMEAPEQFNETVAAFLIAL